MLVWVIAAALVLVSLVGLAAPRAALAAAKAAPRAAFAAAKKQKPAVTSVSPARGPLAGGTIVTISGRALTSAGRSLVTKVKFGAKSATQVSVDAQGRIVCTAPAGKGTVDVVVTTKGGASAPVAADRYAYKAPVVPPVISAFSLRGCTRP